MTSVVNPYINRETAKSFWNNDHPTSIAMRRIFDDLPAADIRVFISVVRDDISNETVVLGTYSSEHQATLKLAECVAAAHRPTCTLMVQQYSLDGKYWGTTYPFEELDKEDDDDGN